MFPHTDRDAQRRLLNVGVRRAGLSHEQLWMRYFALGGRTGALEVDAYLNGLMVLPPDQCDVLAHAVNERLDEQAWEQRVPYSRTLPAPEPKHAAPLAALTRLLEGTHMSPPARLPHVVRQAGRALGVDLTVHLVDYDQRHLVAVRPGNDRHGSRHALDNTLAGRAFRRMAWVVQRGETPRMWLPLLGGVERIGVLEVVMGAGDDPDDPDLRASLGWLSTLLGHLVVIVQQYGDDLDASRRSRPRTVAAELIWNLLPPLTFGTDRFTITGLVEPSYEVGGDAFDYAVRDDVLHVAIFDATGHSLAAGIATAVAMAAYRSARRNGAPLYDVVRSVDETVAEELAGTRFVTAVVAELDLGTGRLRYVAAGHPMPLVVRSGKVVRVLHDGRRPLLGLPSSELTIAEERLQPGDWLLLHTDGVTEARDPDGNQFGDQRLADFLQREAATDHPPPETLRRLFQAVLSHQNDVLQDDATVVIMQWLGDRTQAAMTRRDL